MNHEVELAKITIIKCEENQAATHIDLGLE